MWKEFFNTCVRLIVSPQRAWGEILVEEEDRNDFLNKFLHPIFGIIALTTFVGGLWFSRNGTVESALKETVVSIVSVFGGYYLASYIINELAPRFFLIKDLTHYQLFVGYASIVMYISFIVMPLLSRFSFLWLIAIYTLYIVYAATNTFMQIEEKRRISFTAIASSLIVLVPLIIKNLLELLIK